MSEGKIEFILGGLSFSGHGEQEWLAKQFDKILEAAPQLHKLQPPRENNEQAAAGDSKGDGEFAETLASHIKAKGGESNQTQRFLATADWLRRRGVDELSTAAVTKALSQQHQKRLGNPADCLNKNVSKGFCEKKGDGFFITPDGLKALGYE